MLNTTSYVLTALHREHRAALGPRLAALGLHPGAELALAELWRQEGITQSELAERLNVKRPTVTKLLRTLERDALVYRLGDPEDARVSRVHLTASGRRLRRAVEDAWHGAERETLAALSSPERAQLRRLLGDALRR